MDSWNSLGAIAWLDQQIYYQSPLRAAYSNRPGQTRDVERAACRTVLECSPKPIEMVLITRIYIRGEYFRAEKLKSTFS